MNEINRLDADVLRPSGALLGAQIALSAAIDNRAVSSIGQDPTVIDLVVRLDLAPGQKLRAVDICRQLMLSPSHISRVLDKAEAAGLVKRGPDPSDRRASLITISAEGKRIVAEFAPRLHEVLNTAIFDVLSPTEIETLIDSLERIETAAREYVDTSDPT
jgi:DNA-binding MarR family transcriptional regulator